MKVDMDGKNCNLPSEHTPLGQTNTLASICSSQMGFDTFLRYRRYLNAGWRPYIGDDAILKSDF